MSDALHSEWPGIPEGVRSRTLPIRDLEVHFFEAGKPTDPLIVLLHGFPEIAYSWRKVILPISGAGMGYHVVAPDLRGFGRTKPRDLSAPGAERPLAFEDDVRPHKTLNLVHDIVALVFALGHENAACVVGHDAGAMIAGFSAIVRPELFKSVVFMSTPFTGPSSLPSAVGATSASDPEQHALFPATLVESALATLDPPRKHYMLYYSTPDANADMWRAPQGLHAFLRGYFHVKSADWAENDPHPIDASAAGLAELPHYYVMPRAATMAEVAQADCPSAEDAAQCAWLTEEELAVYAREYGRTGFQGGLNRYRAVTDPALAEELTLFAGRTIDVPAMYLAGSKDWGIYQNPDALDKMQGGACTDMGEDEMTLISGAGHWLQQEKPEVMVSRVKNFLKEMNLLRVMSTPELLARLQSIDASEFFSAQSKVM
ncbi:alpha/beta-hydrolase [Trametes gibbosa]|nr:alpha/beta-hydrolase [Trametes gibbosa]